MNALRRYIRNEQGSSTIGTLVGLAVVVVAIYAGIQMFQVYDKQWVFEDHLTGLVRFAFVNLRGDREAQILAQITNMLDEMDVQYEKKDIRVHVNENTKEITVDIHYTQTVNLPFFPNPKPFDVHIQNSDTLG